MSAGVRVRPDRGVELTGPTISHHLKVLREAGLISGERRGTWICYQVHPEVLAKLAAVLVPPGRLEARGADEYPGDHGDERAYRVAHHLEERGPHAT